MISVGALLRFAGWLLLVRRILGQRVGATMEM